MSDWTPSRIQAAAQSIESQAQAIDHILWTTQRYKPAKRQEVVEDIRGRMNELDKAIREFRDLDTDAMLLKLDKEITLYEEGVL